MKKAIYILVTLYVYTFWQAKAQSASITLEQCIDAALANNPSIKNANSELGIAYVGVKIAQSGLYPSVSIDASGGLSNEYSYGNNYKIGNAKLSVDQILWQNGKVKSSINQADYAKDASASSLDARRQEIILSVKTIYYTCLQQNELYRIAQDNVSKAELFLEYARERYKIGVGRKSDVLKAESDFAEAEFERDSYLSLIKQGQNELAMITGLPVNRLLIQEDIRGINNLGTYSSHADSLISIAFQNYPELQTINNLRLSQEAKIQWAKADFYPRFSLDAGYDWSYNPIVQDQKGWYSVITLRWNIFKGKELRYRLQAEKLKKESYENQTDEIKNFLVKEVNNRLIKIKEAKDQIILSDQLMKFTSENLEVAKAQYKEGTGSMLELTDARIDDLLSKQKNVQAITSFRIAVANLERLMGNTYANKK